MSISPLHQFNLRTYVGPRVKFGTSARAGEPTPSIVPTLSRDYSMFDNWAIKSISSIYLRIPRLPTSWNRCLTPEKYNQLVHLKMDPVNFKTSDGIQLRGYWYPIQNSSKTLILGHGYCASAGIMLPFIKPLHEMGWNVFLFDFRAHGKSKGAKTSLGFHEGKDIAAASKWVRTNKAENSETLVYLGHSVGAAAYLSAPKKLEHDPEDLQEIQQTMKGAVLDSSYFILKPSEDPFVVKFYPVPTNRIKARVKAWLEHLVKGFESQSKKLMDLPSPLNELCPAQLYRESSLMQDKPLMLIHGKNDQRTLYSHGEEVRRTLTEPIQDAPAIEKVQFVSLDADHIKPDWKPTPDNTNPKEKAHYRKKLKKLLKSTVGRVWPKREGYKSVLRDDEAYLRNLRGFLESVSNYFLSN